MNVEKMLYCNSCDSYTNYYLLMLKGDYYNSVVELTSFNNKLVSNEMLASYKKLDFNKDNISDVINSLNINDIDKISLDNFDDLSYSNYILYKTKFIKLNNWIDFYNFIATVI